MNRPSSSARFQSNSIRGEMLRDVMDRTVMEIYHDIIDMFGPGATDGFLTKDNFPYYTRDGKETSSTFKTDNVLANMIHMFLYQAIDNQGRRVGDGSTTLGVAYCHMYNLLREDEYNGESNFLDIRIKNLNRIRKRWKQFVKAMVDKIDARKVPLDENMLKAMLYTCTQDADLTAKIFTELKEPLMAGAYIIPRASNIASDFNVTVHNRPVIKVVRQWSFTPVLKTENCCVVYYVNGILDIVHDEVFAGIARSRVLLDPNDPNSFRRNTVIFLCHGMSEATRNAIRAFEATVRDNHWDTTDCNNIAIYTMAEYRKFESEEIEDLATIFSGEIGLGGMVNPLTFETYLYRAFNVSTAIAPIDTLETFDCDLHIIERFRENFYLPYRIMFDEIEGMAVDRSLNEASMTRYQALKKEIEEEKSQIRKLQLSKRLRRCYGMFIDLEVGSTLLRDSQRKFELILDAIISGSQAAQDGVLIGNSIIHALQASGEIMDEHGDPDAQDIFEPAKLFHDALLRTVVDLIRNYDPTFEDAEGYITARLTDQANYPPVQFNLSNIDRYGTPWPKAPDGKLYADEPIMAMDDDGNPTIPIPTTIVEPVEIIRAIIKNSITPVELARTVNFHIPEPTMGNWVE